jgi:hypothetical protein
MRLQSSATPLAAFRVAPILAFAMSAVCVGPNAQSVTNITFYATSDTHYGQTGTAAGMSKDTARARMVGYLNTLPGTAYPASVGGGTVAVPRAVLIAGDMIEFQDSVQWENYTKEFGVNGEKRLTWPTLEGAGNREFYVTGSIKDTTWMVRKLIARNALRTTSLNKDTSGFHYSWDWDGVHFVNLNLYGGGGELGYMGYRPMRALEFLAQDLAARVGTSGRPVFIMQHYPLRDDAYFPAALRLQMSNIVRNYNVIGILHGHSHNEAVYKWIVSGDTVDVYDDGTAMNGDMMVFQITDGRLRVIARTHGAWSTTVLLDKTISMGEPVRVSPGQRSVHSRTLFSVPGSGWNQAIPASVRHLEILDLAGRRIRVLAVSGDRVEWNGRDASGRRAPPGLYGFKERGKPGVLGKLLLR